MTRHRVIKVHVLAEFSCSLCPSVCLRMTNAAVLPDGRIGEAEDYAGVIVCNECEKKRREADEAEREKSRQRRAWAKKHGVKP